MRPHPVGITRSVLGFLWLVLLLGAWFAQVGDLAAQGREQTATLKIEGMTCGSCAKAVRAALQNVAGVKAVEMTFGTKWGFFNDYANARASVTFDPSQTAVEALIKAVESAGNALSTYRARALPAS